ncbi:GNAT family N-acetyltransferase [Porticoccaceae bacterium LTM1]|nr:GNAT family N-acetyltransferase [Porticoccaceae bacterium LTM1]
MNIRQGNIRDAARIAELITALAKKHIAPEFSVEGKKHLLESFTESAVKKRFSDSYRYLVAEESGELAGIIAMRDNSHIHHLFVADKYQGQGLSRKLWELAKQECQDNGNPGKFTVNASNNAVVVYEAFGFKRSAPLQDTNGVLCNPMTLELKK